MSRICFKGWEVLGVALGLALVVACSGGDRPQTIGQDQMSTGGGAGESSSSSGGDGGSGGNAPSGGVGGSGGSGASGGTSGSGGQTTGSGGGSNPAAAPKVELLVPVDESDPDEVYSTSMDVSCRVEQSDEPGAAPPDPSSVTLDLLDSEGMVIDTRVGEKGDTNDVYEATFPVQNIDAGIVTVRCSAADSSKRPETAHDQADTFVDHGPSIAIVSPKPDAAKSAIGAVAFEYEVTADELVKGDDGAAVEDVTLTVKGVPFEISEVDGEPGVYQASVDFQDTGIFPEVPTGKISVAVNATNERGVTRNTQYQFVLDGVGPELAIVSPVDREVVGGTVSLKMNIVDEESGVDLDTLVVTLNTTDFPYKPDTGVWSVDANVVTFEFDTLDSSSSKFHRTSQRQRGRRRQRRQ